VQEVNVFDVVWEEYLLVFGLDIVWE
jgi:hypothetical protein